MNIGSGPWTIHGLPKIQEGMVRGKPRNCLPSEEKVGTVPPTPQPHQPQKTVAAEGKVGRMSPQEIHWQADFAPSGERPGRRDLYWSCGCRHWGENLWSLHHMDPQGQRMFNPNTWIFSTNTPIYPTPCQICGSLDHQTDYCQGGRRRESEDPSSPSSGEDEALRRRCPELYK